MNKYTCSLFVMQDKMWTLVFVCAKYMEMASLMRLDYLEIRGKYISI